jgi:hypothetical protein
MYFRAILSDDVGSKFIRHITAGVVNMKSAAADATAAFQEEEEEEEECHRANYNTV